MKLYIIYIIIIVAITAVMAVLIKRESKKEYVLSSRNDEELANDEKRKKG
ncbi:MAG: hypothetical protein J5724_01800 [Ruminococcus sp.]|nr:hypothetical protein [Ruminococcus sp.]MBO4493097.1 hypothetical protein [Ruminococcus sp.]MBP5433190.1 hypothetical protein [Ruminococcus sp.]